MSLRVFAATVVLRAMQVQNQVEQESPGYCEYK